MKDNNEKLAFVIAMIIIITVLYFAYLFSCKVCRFFSSPLKSEKIDINLYDRTEFILELSNLELAARASNELLTKEETTVLKIPLWGNIKPSSAKYEVYFSVLYTYYVKADIDKWQLELKGSIAYVSAPGLTCRASVDTSEIRARVDKGWLVIGEDDKLKQLEREISSIAAKRAVDKEHLNIVRETCRKSLSEFIATWFAKEQIPVEAVIITFADEINKSLTGALK